MSATESDVTIVGLQATGGIGQIVLTWAINDPNQDGGFRYQRFDHVEIQRATTVAMTGAETIDDTASTAFADLPIDRGAEWFYRVRAIDKRGVAGDWSSVVSAVEISSQFVIGASGGYWKLPNGFIMQWGFDETDGDGYQTVLFPIPFPNQFFGAIGVTGDVDGSVRSKTIDIDRFNNPAILNSGFEMRMIAVISSGGFFGAITEVPNEDFFWVAFGY